MVKDVLPNYIQYYFRRNQELFSVLSDMDDSEAIRILGNDTQWRAEGTYIFERKKHEEHMRETFIRNGGIPKMKYPIYAILGESPCGEYDLENEYEYKIVVSLEIFNDTDISFTYPDSLYEVPIDDLEKYDLNRCDSPKIVMRKDIEETIWRYKPYSIGNHYVEVQIWNIDKLESYKGQRNWIKCNKREVKHH
jgi:hypothetical protein